MQHISIKKGLNIPIEGAAHKVVDSPAHPPLFRILPHSYFGLTPKLLVRTGDRVLAGSPLFHDKTFEQILVTSPVSGTVQAITRGDRRKVLSIDIAADSTNEFRTFDTSDRTPDGIKQTLLQSGLWTLIKQLPYDCIALPQKQPAAIFISTFDTAPLAPDYEFILNGQDENIQTAIDALATLAPVFVGIRDNAAPLFAKLTNCTLYSVDGPHPAGNTSVQINHIRPLKTDETIWTLNPQDAALIGKLFLTQRCDCTRLVALTGPDCDKPRYIAATPGTPLQHILPNLDLNEKRLIRGNVISGSKIDNLNDSIAFSDNQFSIIKEGNDVVEFMGWAKPITQPKHWDARLKGGLRAFIVSNEYDSVFPMDIFPELLVKAMIAGNTDKMIQLGAKEVTPADFALCEFLCTSKIPVQSVVRTALDNLRKELEA